MKRRWLLPVLLWWVAVGATGQEPSARPETDRLATARRAFDDALGHLASGLVPDARRARDLLRPAVTSFRQAGLANAEAEALYALGLAHAQMAETATALELYGQALELQRELGDVRGEAATRNNIGLILAETGRPIEAFAHLEASLARRRAVGDDRGEAATLNNLAALHVQLGELQSGLDRYHRALTLHRQLDDPAAEAATLNNLGLALARLGEHGKAEAHLRRALALHRAVGGPRDEAGTLSNLGLANFALDRFALALGQLTAARDLYRSFDDPAGLGDVLNNLGLVHLEAGHHKPARQAFEQALEVQRRLGDRLAEAAVLSNLGRLFRQRRRFDSAGAHLESALALQRQLGDAWAASFSLLELARLDADRGRLEPALATIEEAIANLESLRATVLSPGYRTSLLGDRRELYELRVDLLMRLDREHPGVGHDVAALVAAEAGKARGLLDSLGEVSAGLRRDADPEMLIAQRDLRRRLGDRETARRRQLQEGDPPAAEAIGDEIETLLGEYRRLEAEVRARDPRYADLVRPEPLTAEAMRGLLDDDTVLLEYSLGEERGNVWTVTSTAVTGHVLADRERIEQAARRLHERLSKSRQRAFTGPARVAAAELAELILEPVREVLGHRRIVVVADGALEVVPFGILPEPGTGGQPLGLSHEVVAMPSVSVLASQRRSQNRPRSPTQTARKTLAIVADPVFAAADPRLGDHEGKAEAVEEATEELPRLVHSRREAEAIAAMVPADQRLLALGFAAHRELFTDGTLEPFRRVHIATHGVLDTRRPELSSLVLSRFDAEGKARDGDLNLLDVYNLRLQAELVVLSACRTALGREIRGEGLISLARGFLYAGARQVLVSLWQVDDEATAVLMERFYRGLLVDGLPAAAALRNAQAQVAADPRWRAPYYWSGFVLQGDWR